MNDCLYIARVYTEPSFYVGEATKRQLVNRVRVSFSKEELEVWVFEMKQKKRVARSRVELLNLASVRGVSIPFAGLLVVSVAVKGGIMNDYAEGIETFRLDIPKVLAEKVERMVGFYKEYIHKK